MKTIYGRQFALMASVVLLSFALLGGSFMSLSYQYILSEKRQSLERNAATVADMTAYALRERGYHAVGGEALALLLPVVYYCAAATVRDIIEDWRERR